MNSEHPDIADAARVIAWATDPARKPANLAFTAGPERQAAYWIEWADGRRAAGVREAIEACAKLCDPSNADHPDDWTEYAKVRAECAAAIRATLPRE